MEELVIERLGHLGDGIAPGPVFVARALPGEVVSGAVQGGRLAAPKIVTPTADRVSPPCRHYKSCGGCTLQHAKDDFVASWKQDVVMRALGAHGLDAPIRKLHTSSPATRRRATFGGRRTKKEAIVGFHAASSETLVPIPDCMILSPALLAVLPTLEAIVAQFGSRKGEMRLTVTEVGPGLDIAIEDAKPLDLAGSECLAGLAADSQVARVSWNGEVALQRQAPTVSFDAIQVPLPPGAFLQATLLGEQALRRSVSEAIGRAKTVVDLFAGCGTFGLPIARSAAVHAVENDRVLTDALLEGWKHANGLKSVSVECRDLFRRPLLAEELADFEAAVIDPPRAGAEAQTNELAASGIPHIASVSCNPTTFARDAAVLLNAGYSLDWIDIVDQFLWSAHVELVAHFLRR